MSRIAKAKSSSAGHSKQFFDLIRSIGEAKSKQEEDKIILREIAVLKTRIVEKDNDHKKMKEYILRLIYCEMLGHMAEFGYIHAVNLISSGNLVEKRVGYLAVGLCLHSEHEFMLLLISNIQKDLKSTNYLEVGTALQACCKLVGPELVACVLTDVKAALTHTNPMVRKKAIMTMHAFFRRSSEQLGSDLKAGRQALCDADPSVMGASLHFLYELAVNDPEGQKELVKSFLDILKQITEHRLPKDYDYHRIPAPWIQIKLLKIISILCADDRVSSEKAFPVLSEVMKRADTGLNIGHAVIFEAVRTVTNIYPSNQLIEMAADSISKFLTHPNPNLKYLGITALSSIVRIDAKYAAQHQMIVIDCLEDPDETIKRKTLDLLYAMTNATNVEVIILRLIKFLGGAHDAYLKRDLVEHICELSEKYGPSNKWYVDTINDVLLLAAQYVRTATVQGILKLIAEGSGEDDDEDMAFRLYCVNTYYYMLDSDRTYPSTVYQVIAWVLGEYGFMAADPATGQSRVQDIIDRLTDLMDRLLDDNEPRMWIVTGLMKLVSQNENPWQEQIQDMVEKYKNSQSMDLQQRCYEMMELSQYPAVMAQVLPLDGCCEDIEVDEKLSFLDPIIQQSLDAGAACYDRERVMGEGDKEEEKGLRTEAYVQEVADDVLVTSSHGTFGTASDALSLDLSSTKKKWGVEMLNEPEPSPEPVSREIVSNPPMSPRDDDSDDDDGADEYDSGVVQKKKVKAKKSDKEAFQDALFGGAVKKKKKKPKDEVAPVAVGVVRKKKVAKDIDGGMKNLMLGKTSSPTGSDRAVSSVGSYTSTTSAQSDFMDSFGVQSASRIPSAPSVSSGGGLDDLFGVSSPPSMLAAVADLTITPTKQHLPDQLCVMFTIISPIVASNVQVALALPSKLQLIAASPPGVVGSGVTFSSLTPGSQANVSVSLAPQDVQFGTTLVGQLNYSDATGQTRMIPLSVALDVVDFIRPVTIDISTFGTKWQPYSCQAADTVAGLAAPEQVVGVLESTAHVKTVQVIGQELCLYGNFIGIDEGVLVHAKCQGTNALITVRTRHKPLSDQVLRAIKAHA